MIDAKKKRPGLESLAEYSKQRLRRAGHISEASEQCRTSAKTAWTLRGATTMWISRAHYALLTKHVDEARSDFDVRLNQFGATISAQQAQIHLLEEDRRELVRLLLVREDRRTAPAIAVPDTTPPEGWEAIMRKQIEDQEAI